MHAVATMKPEPSKSAAPGSGASVLIAAKPQPTLASLVGASKRYGKLLAVDNVDLQVRAGEVLAVLGPNGAGKTTAISLLLGLLQADGGTAELFGMAPKSLAARRRIGAMLQTAAVPEALNVGELIALFRSYYPNPRSVAECAALAGVEELLGRRYGKLSGGQQRRVQFALAVVGKPDILFLDEPTTGLDIEAREILWKTIRKLVADGCAIVLTTHYLEEAEALADRVVVLARGRIVAEGSVAAIRSRVSQRRIRCISTLASETILCWPHVRSVTRDGEHIEIVTDVAESVVRKLLDKDADLSELEIRRAGLAEAFRRNHQGSSAMNAVVTHSTPRATNSPLSSYLMEAKFEFLRVLRTPAFAAPTLLFPPLFYLLFGLLLNHGRADAAHYLFATYSVFGVMAPSLFGFGVGVAIERERGWLALKRVAPMPPGAYLLAKMAMAIAVRGDHLSHPRDDGVYARWRASCGRAMVRAWCDRGLRRAAVLRDRLDDRCTIQRERRAGLRQPDLPADGLPVRAVDAAVDAAEGDRTDRADLAGLPPVATRADDRRPSSGHRHRRAPRMDCRLQRDLFFHRTALAGACGLIFRIQTEFHCCPETRHEPHRYAAKRFLQTARRGCAAGRQGRAHRDRGGGHPGRTGISRWQPGHPPSVPALEQLVGRYSS